MNFIKIHLRRKINNLVYRSSIAFFFERNQMILYFGFNPFSRNHESIIFYRQFKCFFFNSSQREQNYNLLRRFINIIRNTWRFLFLFHVSESYNINFTLNLWILIGLQINTNNFYYLIFSFFRFGDSTKFYFTIMFKITFSQNQNITIIK